MAGKYQMQARSSSNGLLYTWVSSTQDWAASLFPGPAGTAVDVALACAPLRGLVAPGTVTATITATVTSPTASIAATVGTVFLPGFLEALSWGNADYVAGITRKQFAANILK